MQKDKNFLPVELEFELVGVIFVKELDADFLGYDLSADVIFLCKAQSHLLKDKINLFKKVKGGSSTLH